MNGMFLERRLAYNTPPNTPSKTPPAPAGSPQAATAPAASVAAAQSPQSGVNPQRAKYQSSVMKLLTGAGIQKRVEQFKQASGVGEKTLAAIGVVGSIVPYAAAGYALGGGVGAAVGASMPLATSTIGVPAALGAGTAALAGAGVGEMVIAGGAAALAAPVIRDAAHHGWKGLKYTWRGKEGNEFGQAGVSWGLKKTWEGVKHVGGKGVSTVWKDKDNPFGEKPVLWDISVGPAISVLYYGFRAQLDTMLSGVGQFGRRAFGKTMQGLGFLTRNKKIKEYGNLQVKDSQGVLKNLFSIIKETKDNVIDTTTAFILRPTSSIVRLFLGKNIADKYNKAFTSVAQEIKEGRLAKSLFEKASEMKERRKQNRKSLLPNAVMA